MVLSSLNGIDITKAITEAAVEAAKAAVQAVEVAGAVAGAGTRCKVVSTGPIPNCKLGRPLLKEPFFDSSAKDKYAELRNFQLEVNDIFLTCGTRNSEKISVIKNWLGKSQHFIQTLTKAEQEAHGTYKLINFNHNLMKQPLSLQYSKLNRKSCDTTEDWMGRLKVMEARCKC